MRDRIAFFFWWLFWASLIVLLATSTDEVAGAVTAACADVFYLLYVFIRTDYDSTIIAFYKCVIGLLAVDILISAFTIHSPIVFYVIGPCVPFYIYSEGVSKYAVKH